jgi:hypothetical protein
MQPHGNLFIRWTFTHTIVSVPGPLTMAEALTNNVRLPPRQPPPPPRLDRHCLQHYAMADRAFLAMHQAAYV